MAWFYRGGRRPAFAEAPGPGQESIWDYPRPPALVADTRRVRVEIDGEYVAETVNAYRMLETAGAPTFYLPPDAVVPARLIRSATTSYCEWKGDARYWHVIGTHRRATDAAWVYPEPDPKYDAIRGYLAVHAGDLECFVNGERAHPQPGGFYGGWVTHDVVGPFKGGCGTGAW